MHADDFNATIGDQMDICRDMLVVKAGEYATDDKLSNFKKGAELTGETPRQVLMGYMAKHTISVFEMGMSEEEFSIEKWTEKISDHINYLLILKALVVEEMVPEPNPVSFVESPMAGLARSLTSIKPRSSS